MPASMAAVAGKVQPNLLERLRKKRDESADGSTAAQPGPIRSAFWQAGKEASDAADASAQERSAEAPPQKNARRKPKAPATPMTASLQATSQKPNAEPHAKRQRTLEEAQESPSDTWALEGCGMRVVLNASKDNIAGCGGGQRSAAGESLQKSRLEKSAKASMPLAALPATRSAEPDGHTHRELASYSHTLVEGTRKLGIGKTKLDGAVKGMWPSTFFPDESEGQLLKEVSTVLPLAEDASNTALQTTSMDVDAVPLDSLIETPSASDSNLANLEASTTGPPRRRQTRRLPSSDEAYCETQLDSENAPPSTSGVIMGLESSSAQPARPEDELFLGLQDVSLKLDGFSYMQGAEVLLKKVRDVLVQKTEDPAKRSIGELKSCLGDFASLEEQLRQKHKDAEDDALRAVPHSVLQRARGLGSAVGRALHVTIDGVPGKASSALTLSEELVKFAADSAGGHGGLRVLGNVRSALTPQEAAAAAADMWAAFGGVEKYAAYLTEVVEVAHADVPLSGGAAWQRLLAEIEVAMMLVDPVRDDLSLHCASRGSRLNANWAPQLMFHNMFPPLLQRIRYVAARVRWSLGQQHLAATEWMQAVRRVPRSLSYAQSVDTFAEALENSLMRNLISEAMDNAAAATAVQVLKNLENTLEAGCQGPHLLHKLEMKSDFESFKVAQTIGSSSCDRVKATRQRVREEMKRSAEPEASPQVLLQRRFVMLQRALTSQAVAFAENALHAFRDRRLDDAVCAMALLEEQSSALNDRHRDLQVAVQRTADAMHAVQKCSGLLHAAFGHW